MVKNGYGHEELNAMAEDEFLFLLETRIELDEAMAEAQKDAQKGT